jgi:type II secretory pathway pseudopilin PulG
MEGFMRNRNKLGLIAIIFCCMPVIALAQQISLNDNTLGAVFFNIQRVYDVCMDMALELAKPENNVARDEINEQIKSVLRVSDFDVEDYLVMIKKLKKDKIFIPSGPMLFSIDAKYRPILQLKANTRPLLLYQTIMSALDNPLELKADVANEKLVEITLPTPQFKLKLSIEPESIFLVSDEKNLSAQDTGKWGDFKNNFADKNNLLDVQIDFDRVKQLLAEKNLAARHSVCLGNLRTLKNALEMYRLDNGSDLERFDIKILLEKHYLAAEPACPKGGNYSLSHSNKGEVYCTIHGSIENPKAQVEDANAHINPQLKPFKAFRLQLSTNSIEFKMQLSDKQTLEQWLAIARQQLLTVRHMAENQLGHLPEAQKKRTLAIVNSIECQSKNEWLVVSAAGIDEKTMAMGIVGGLGGLASQAIPRFIQTRKNERMKACYSNRRMLSDVLEMYNLDNPEKKMNQLDLNALVDGGYIKEAPVCNEGGIYSLNEEDQVECSKHGL